MNNRRKNGRHRRSSRRSSMPGGMSPKEGLRKTMAEWYALLQSVPANDREHWLEVVRSTTYEYQDVGLEDLSLEQRKEVHNMATIPFPQAKMGFLKGLLSGTLTMADFDEWFETLFP